MVNALIVGVVTGLLAWWLISRLPVPRLGISAVARIPSQARAGAWLYRVKIVNLGRRVLPRRPAIDVRVVATVRIRGLNAVEPKKWNNFDVPLVNGGRVAVLAENTIVTLRTEEIDLARRPLLSSALGSRDSKDLDLERMLCLGNKAELRLMVTASDPYTHATTTKIAYRHVDGILSGPFRDAPGRRGLEVLAGESAEAELRSAALLLTGAPGAGKSSVLDALSTLLEADGVAHGAIESEQLARGAPLLGADVWSAQLAAVLRQQRGAGRRLFLVAATTETREELRAVLDAANADRALVVCLTAPAELIAERLDRREPDRWPGKAPLIAHARELAVSIPALDGIDVSIDTAGQEPEEVAALVQEELRARGMLG
jgi:chloramphenicol 3-O-phosphotransferase